MSQSGKKGATDEALARNGRNARNGVMTEFVMGSERLTNPFLDNLKHKWIGICEEDFTNLRNKERKSEKAIPKLIYIDEHKNHYYFKQRGDKMKYSHALKGRVSN